MPAGGREASRVSQLLLIGALFLLAATGLGRFGLGRSERRSVKSYQKGMKALADLTAKSDAAAPVKAVRSGEAAVPTPASRPALPWSGGRQASRSRKARKASPTSADRRLVFGEEAEVPLHLVGNESSGQEADWRSTRRRHRTGGRLPAAASVVVLLVAGAAAAVIYTRAHHHHASPAGHSRSHQHGGSTSTTTPVTTPTTTAVPSVLVPVSSTPLGVTFTAPPGQYHLLLKVTGSCWIGIEKSSAGPFLKAETLVAGQSLAYSATGPLVLRIGAPPEIRVLLNGKPARLPDISQPFDVTLTPA